MSQANSHRQILRSSSIIAGAALVNIGVGLLSAKAVAVLLGPAGVGLLGLLQGLVAVAASVAALGWANVGTKRVAAAAASNDGASLKLTCQALAWGTLLLGTVGALGFWALRSLLATHILGRPDLGTQLGWLSLAVGFTVVGTSQTAVLNGLRRVGDLARLSVGAAVLSAIAGTTAVLLWKRDGLMLFVLAGPIASVALGYWFVRRVGAAGGSLPKWTDLATQWKGLASLGTVFMLTGVIETAVHLSVRTMVQRELGAGSLGLFQAAWTVSMTYIGLVLSAMAADFYPRLAGIIQDSAKANRLVNEQTEVALLLGGPVFLVILGFAPMILTLLYAESFEGAASVLRWQVLGDVLKVVSWPIGFVFLAAGDGRTFFVTETLALAVYGLVSWLALPALGVQATGIGFLVMYAMYLPIVYRLASRKTGFRWTRENMRLLATIAAAACAIAWLGHGSPRLAAYAGAASAIALGSYSLNRLASLAAPGRSLAGLLPAFAGALSKWRKWR